MCQATAILNCFLSPFDITSPVIECVNPRPLGRLKLDIKSPRKISVFILNFYFQFSFTSYGDKSVFGARIKLLVDIF